MSSLSPTNLFGVGASALPTLFLEARIHGGGGSHADELITQLGLSLTSDHVDVALFTRTSGIVLIAGVGSYCAYRICAKYLGKEFVWTLRDAARFDRLSRADSRLLHPAAEGYLSSRQSSTFYEERARQRLCQLLRSLSEDDRLAASGGLSVLGSSGRQSPAAISHAGSSLADERQRPRYRLLSTRSGSPVRIVCSSNQLLKRAMRKADTSRGNRNEKPEVEGLGAIKHYEAKDDDLTLNTRKHVPLVSEDERCDTLSDLTSVSRACAPAEALLRTNCCADVDGDVIVDEDEEDRCSRSSCRRSSVHEPLSWDDEFRQRTSSATNLLFSCDSSSNISELSAMKNLEAMWAGDGEKRGRLDSSATSLILRLNNCGLDDEADETASNICPANLAQLIESKCSGYMYQSVHLGDADWDATSAVSASNQSVLSEGFRATLASHDLWEHKNSSSSQLNHEKNQSKTQQLNPVDEPTTSFLMTNSYESKCSSSSRSQKRSAMFDSAIGTDFMSSDDDKSSTHGYVTKHQTKRDKTTKLEEPKKQTSKVVPQRSWLDKINEKPSPQHRPRRESVVSSVAPSVQSLEWDEEVHQSGSRSKVPIQEGNEGTPI